jgi:hypothetical protein
VVRDECHDILPFSFRPLIYVTNIIQLFFQASAAVHVTGTEMGINC